MRPRVAPLDGLRGLAIVAVIAWHYIAAPWGLDRPAAGPALSADGFARLALGLSWGGVDLFFALSGYLIGDILLRAREATNYYAVFAARRLCRLAPLYLLTLAGFWLARELLAGEPALTPLFEPGLPGWAYLIGVQNLLMAHGNHFGPGWLAVTWSLAVEWQFYLLAPVLVRRCPRATLPWALALLCLAAPLVRGALPPLAGYVSLAGRVDGFCAGMLVATVLGSPVGLQLVRRHRPHLRAALAVVAAGAVLLAMKPAAFGGTQVWTGPFTHSWLALGSALVIALALTRPEGRGAAWLSVKPLRALGHVSYGVYLMHQPVNWLVHWRATGAGPTLATPLAAALTLLALGLTLALATLTAATVERVFVALGRRARYRYPAPADAAETPAPAHTLQMATR